MSISLNKIGNYTPNIKARTAAANTEKFSIAQNPEMKTKAASEEKNNITTEEKKFFMDLYPESKNEITDYHFYQKSGQMSGIKIGSIFDRRG